MDLLGLGSYKDSIFNGGFKIKKNMPKSDKQIINTLNNMAVALSEGLEIKTSDLDVFRPDIENLTKADMIARAKELGVEGAETKAFARKSKEEITKAIRKQFGKRKMRASKQTPEGGRAQVINEVEKNETHYKTPKERIPKKTVKAYKLVRVGEDGKLYPLFANANTPFEEGEWMSAGIGKRKTIKGKEKVVGKGMSSGLAPRAGFHTADVLIASQIGGKARPTDTKPNYRVSDTIWVEVEVGNDVDWQAEANKRGKGRKAEITETTPQGGHYKYKTNPNMTGEWLVSGEMKITKRLTKLERKEIAEKTGINDLPSLTDLMEMENIKFEDLNKQSQKEFNKTNKRIRFSKARGDFKVPVKEGVNIEDFDGVRVSTTQSDKLLGGYFNQQRFLGGVFYPAITGRIWAATNKTVANNIARQFEGVEPNEDGYYYLIPIVMGEDTHLSNQTMRKMFFQHFGTALKNNELTRGDLVDEIQRVTSLAPFKGKKLTMEN